MLQISNLSVNLELAGKKITAVDDISFLIEPGEVVALIGESGSGKSMTALAIMRLLPQIASYGVNSQICLYGSNIIDLTEQQMRMVRGGDIGMIFQDPMTSLNPVLTVGAQITEVLNLHQKLYGRECYIAVLRLLEAVRIPSAVQRFNSYPHELSGGMKQRVMIAIALASKSSLLIADEPTTALDVTTQAQILNLLRELQHEFNMALLLITHDLAVAAQMADRIAVMQAGKIVEQNSAAKIFTESQHAYTKKLLNSLPQLHAGLSGKQNLPQHNALEVKNLQVNYPVKYGIFRRTVGFISAVKNVDFSLSAGETLAIVGESGCGKTSIAKAILGLLPGVACGTVMFKNNNLLQLRESKLRQLRAGIQIVFQDPYAALNPKLRIFDSLTEGLTEPSINYIDQLLMQVGLLPEHKWRFPHEFSGGERQRLCIARALSVKPQVIICDEPTSSLDVSVQAQVLDLLKKLQLENNLSYIFITHDLALVNYLAHKVVVMYQGQIVEYGLVAEVLINPQHQYTRTLLAAVPKITNYKKALTD